jgi:uncharacterized protein
VDKIEQVVRLIRSKGVGVYFVTQNPLDIPDKVLAQLGNRVQHALRAFTPRDQKAVRTAADTLRTNPAFDTRQAITELGVGEALVSSQLGPIAPEDRRQLIATSVVAGVYEKTVDRESAFEMLKQRAGVTDATTIAAPSPSGAASPPEATRGGGFGSLGDILFGTTGPRGGRREGAVEAMTKSAARSVGSSLARELTRGVLGSLLGGGRRR